MAVPATSRIVIIGGGVIGCSIAYHLAKRGERDVTLIERLQLTHGATWHAAGLVGQLRSSSNLTRLMKYSAELYGKLEAETGPGHRMARLGQPAPRLVAGALAGAEALGDDGQGLRLPRRPGVAAGKRRELFPLMTTDGVVGAAWIEGDGYVDPTSLTNAYAAGARAGGVQDHPELSRDRARPRRGRRVTTVVTDQGEIETECVINAAGMWGREIAAMVGTRVPACAVEHQYFVTEKTTKIPDGLPSLRDPDHNFYVKPEPGALAVGGWEDEHAAVGRQRHRAGLRSRTAAAGLRPLRAAGGSGGHAHPGAERSGHPANDQRPHSDHGGRRADHRPLARARQLLPVLRLHVRHRGVGRRGHGDGQLDRRRRPGHGPVAVRRAPLRRAAFGQAVHVRARGRKLRPLLPRRVADQRVGCRPRRAAQSAARAAQGHGRRLRQQVRLGASQLVRAGRYAGRRHAVVRAWCRRSRPSATSTRRSANASR